MPSQSFARRLAITALLVLAATPLPSGSAGFHDSSPPFVAIHATSVRGDDPTAGRSPVSPPCETTGPAVQLVHAVPEGQPGTPEQQAREHLIEGAAWMNGDVVASARADGGMRQIRFAMAPDCRPDVVHVSYTADPGVMNVVVAIRGALTAAGHSRADRIYLAWADGQAAAPEDGDTCGLANRRRDDRPAPVGHPVDEPLYGMALTDCADAREGQGFLHELFHMLGAAQESAPHFDSAGHVADGFDLMGAFHEGSACPDPQAVFLADCNNDDYFAIDPPPGSYLDTHWNVADSPFLTSADPGAGPGDMPIARFDQPDVDARAAAVSQRRMPDATSAPARVLLARDDEVADSLAASPLLSDAVLLYSSSTSLSTTTADELRRLLALNRSMGIAELEVTILGGEQAISGQVEETVRQLDPAVTTGRLSGPSRVETALAIADAATDTPFSVAIARASGTTDNPTAGWADAIASGAFLADEQVPLLLTPTDSLHPAVSAWLDAREIGTTYVLGGPAAVSETVAGDLPGDVVRLAGLGRDGTAAEVNRAWSRRGLDSAVAFNGYATDGWRDGLLAAGLAADERATLLLVDARSVPPATTELLGTSCPGVLVVGTVDAVSQQVVDQIVC